MKKITLIFLLIIISSCKQENEPYSMYGLLIEEFVHSNGMLKDQIDENFSNENLINDKSSQLYHNSTTEYLNYLDSTYAELINKIKDPHDYNGELSDIELVNSFFFNGEEYNEKATEFVSKLENYRTEISNLIVNKNLVKRVLSELNTDYVLNREGKKFSYLNYMYKDLPLVSVLAHMKYREKVIMEFENDFLKNRILNK